MSDLKIEYVNIGDLKEYKNNAKRHPKKQIEQIKESITKFNMIDPIGVWKDNSIIEVNERAREEQSKKDSETSENKFDTDFFDKPKKRKRRTKSEILKTELPNANGRIYNEESIKNAVENFNNSEKIGNLEHPVENKDFIIRNVTTDENDNVTDYATKEVNSDTKFNVEKNEDELPFELTEEERQNILGIEFAGIENGKAKYVAPEVKVKRPRGRPRKIKLF